MVNLFIAVLLGILFPLQASINAALGRHLASPLQASFISFAGGALLLLIVTAISPAGLPSLAAVRGAGPLLCTGGLYGAIFVTMSVVLTPKIGTANFFAAVLLGQLCTAVIFDRLQLFGLPYRAVSWQRLLGIALCFLGLYFMSRSPSS